MKIYAWTVCCVLGLLLFVTAGWCLLVDPYRVFSPVGPVEYFEPNVRLWKTTRLCAVPHDFNGVILGNSLPAQFSCESINGSGLRFFNYATSSETINESYAKLRFLYEHGKMPQAVVVFVSLNALSPPVEFPVQDLLRQDHPGISGGNFFGLWCRYLLSREAIEGTLSAAKARKLKNRIFKYAPDGAVTYGWALTADQFRSSVEGLRAEFPADALVRELEWHRKIAQMSKLHGTHVCLVVSPVPAPVWDTYMKDACVLEYLRGVGEIYGVQPLRAEDRRLYEDFRFWNDPAHCTPAALEQFFSPKIRQFLADQGVH